MLPLQWVGFGLALVLVDLSLEGYDVLADPLGWLLVLVGLGPVRRQLSGALTWLAAVGLVASVVAYPPGLRLETEPALLWALSLPHLAFEVVLALALAAAVPERRGSFRVASWLLVAAALLPVPALVLGAPAMLALVALLGVAASVYLVTLVLLSARRLPRSPRPHEATRAAP